MLRLLLDSCVWGGACEVLRAAGWDVEWVPSDGTDPGDEAVLSLSLAEGRVLVTLDKDLGELVHVRGLPHAGIVRLHGFAARDQAERIREVVERHADDLAAGSLLVVSPNRVRLRAPRG